MAALRPVLEQDDLTIEISGGDIADGTYQATLTALDPLVVTVKDPETGDDVERDLLRWTFALDDGSGEIEGVTSRATGPKSKMHGWLVALVGADAVAPGKRFGRRDLIGREAMIVVGRDKNGYGKVTSVVPRPR